MSALRILELYPQHLNVNGDTGNAFVLEQRLNWAGVAVERLAHRPGDVLPDEVDLVSVGNGPEAAQVALADEIAAISSRLREWAEAGVGFIAVSGGFELLCRGVRRADGSSLAGAGVFDAEVELGAPRQVSKCFVVDTDFGRLVGVENQGAVTRLSRRQEPLGRVVLGAGNRDGQTEGAIAGNAVGTHLHGPVLASNPVLADHLAARAAGRKALVYARTERHAEIDELARQTRLTLLAGTGLADAA